MKSTGSVPSRASAVSGLPATVGKIVTSVETGVMGANAFTTGFEIKPKHAIHRVLNWVPYLKDSSWTGAAHDITHGCVTVTLSQIRGKTLPDLRSTGGRCLYRKCLKPERAFQRGADQMGAGT
jgi:hypothetical protein